MNALNLSVVKALRSARFISEALGKPTLADKATFDAWVHDLSLVAGHGNLRSVRVIASDAGKQCLYEHVFEFAINGFVDGKLSDSGQGVELPMLPRPVAEVRVTWTTGPSGNWEQDIAPYRSHMKVAWSSSERVRPPDGSSFDSEHHRKITGGRATATVHVAKDVRHTGRVVRTGTRGFVFVEDDRLGRTVFAHLRHLRTPGVLHLGQRVSYVIVSVPRGLQARDIELMSA